MLPRYHVYSIKSTLHSYFCKLRPFTHNLSKSRLRKTLHLKLDLGQGCHSNSCVLRNSHSGSGLSPLALFYACGHETADTFLNSRVSRTTAELDDLGLKTDDSEIVWPECLHARCSVEYPNANKCEDHLTALTQGSQ